MIEAFFEQTRRAGMIFRRTRPEHSVVSFDLFPGDTVVIGVPATRSDAHLVEDFARRIERKIFLSAHAMRNLLHDPPIGAGFTGRIVRLINLHDAAFAVAGHAFVFAPG